MSRHDKTLALLRELPEDIKITVEEAEAVEKIFHEDSHDFRPTSIQSIVTGTFILWICWIFFNAGSSKQLVNNASVHPDLIVMNTILAASSGGIIALLFKHPIAGTYEKRVKYDVTALCNGIITGLVAVSASCNDIEPWAAIIIGGLAGAFLGITHRLLMKLKIDDPIEASQVHGFGGILGLILLGFFHKEKGIFYGDNGRQLGV